MMHHEIMFCFLHQARPSSPNVTISCGLTSHIFQNLSESEGIIVQELSLPTKMVITAIELHHSSCTHIIMTWSSSLVGQRFCSFLRIRRAPNRALFCVSPCCQIVLFSAFCLCTKPCFFCCVSPCTKSCSFLRFVVLQIVLFSAFRRAPNCAFLCVSLCTTPCSFLRWRRAPSRALLLRFFMLQIAVFGATFRRASIIMLCSALRHAPNRDWLF